MTRHLIFGGALLFLGSCVGHVDTTDGEWAYYNGDPAGSHYSRLKDINTGNVGDLEIAWVYDTDDAEVSGSEMEANPLVVRGQMFIVSPKGRLISLDGATGRELWAFDPAGSTPVRTRQRLRGVSYWTDGKNRRILFTFRGYLYAIDADTGRPAAGFGSDSRVALSTGIERDPRSISVANVTPGAVYKDLIIMGSTGNTPGDIRAFDVRTGKLRWTFHTIPRPGETGYDTWPKDAWKSAMGANCWAGMTLDEARGLVFVPLASSGMGNKDHYGADRIGDNLFANSLVALDANTGRRVWHFQTIRHDLWDWDLPAPPTLVSVVRNGKRVDAIAQITKSGFVYVLDRLSGKPLFPLVEKTAFPSDVPGEVAAKTQIEPRLPAPFARQHLTANLLTQRTPQAAAAVAATFATLRSRGLWDPPSEQGTIVFPGFDGGGEWGGGAYDPETGLFYVNANEMAWIAKLKKRPPHGTSSGGLYREHCASCHGESRAGNPPEFPSLIGIGDRLPEMDILMIIAFGSGRMPSFGHLDPDQIESVAAYLRTGADIPRNDTPSKIAAPRIQGDAYVFDGYTKFLDPDGYPAVAPPWGTLSAINLNTGDYAWKIPFGEYPELAAAGLRNTGSENYGGAVVTAGGLLFIGATSYDRKFHAFDKRTGALLWETTLPNGGNATPATYLADGRQFVVIAAGGGKDINHPVRLEGQSDDKRKPGAKVIAFALPK